MVERVADDDDIRIEFEVEELGPSRNWIAERLKLVMSIVSSNTSWSDPLDNSWKESMEGEVESGVKFVTWRPTPSASWVTLFEETSVKANDDMVRYDVEDDDPSPSTALIALRSSCPMVRSIDLLS